MRWLFAAFGGFRVGFLGLLVLLVVYLSTTVVPAGHVGVQDFFGRVSDRILSPGINLIVPGTHVLKFSVQPRELKETAAVPTSEGLVVNLDVSLLFRLRPEAAARVYKTVGSRFESVVTAIQEKLQAEQQAQRIRFVLDREHQEAERKRVEAQGIADFQSIVARGISPELLKWKAIEVAHELSKSPNAKVIVLEDKTGLPIILSDK